jgi:1-deoxy-D-xylulose-5-phosphate reductoisomerase
LRRRLVILGSTGSIGTQTLEVVRRLPDRFQIVGLAANNGVSLLARQANEFGAVNVCIGNEKLIGDLDRLLPADRTRQILSGVEGMCALASLPEADVVVVAVAGAIGIGPTHAGLAAGKDIALASKEVLVAAGEPTMELARRHNCRIVPIDSEHSAIFQCLQGAPKGSLERLYLTASGGPFRKATAEQMEHVTPEQALRHPTWNMGGLVTINSATLMNKGLEIIEAHWLFDVPVADIEVVVHPQSIVHSMVRLRDGSTLAQLGLPDMRLPIQYALTYPERVDSGLPRMGLETFANLEFEPPDEARFPALGLARAAAASGGTLPAVMNAANEAAVQLFLDGRIAFPDVMRLVSRTMLAHDPLPATLQNVLDADAGARREVAHFAGSASTVSAG